MPKLTEEQELSSKVCKVCRERKPNEDFVVTTIGYMKKYSDTCAKCRDVDWDDEGGSGGKKSKLALDSSARQQMLADQQEGQEQREADKQEAREEFVQDGQREKQESNEKQKEKSTAKEDSAQKQQSAEVAKILDRTAVNQLIAGGIATQSYIWMNQILKFLNNAGGATTFTMNYLEKATKAHSGRFLSHSDRGEISKQQNNLMDFISKTYGTYNKSRA